MLFNYAFSKNQIEILDYDNKIFVDEKIALINNMNIDYEFPKIFFMVLKKTHEQLINLKYTKIVQHVSLEDWYNILNKTGKWRIIEINHKEKSALVMCDIKDLIDCIISAFDL